MVHFRGRQAWAMMHGSAPQQIYAFLLLSMCVYMLFPASGMAHEMWVLPPAEIAGLASDPTPYPFSEPCLFNLSVGILAALIMAVAARRLTWVRDLEHRVFAPAGLVPGDVIPLVLRLGLAAMLFTAAFGLLPRHGNALGAEATLLVPDLELNRAAGGGWMWLAEIQFVLAVLLVTGLAVRLAGAAICVLVLAGFLLFGEPMASYAGHFLGPAVYLTLAGAGRYAASGWRLAGFAALETSLERIAPKWGTKALQVLTGLQFVYLAVRFKVLQPTLIVAIVEHGNIPTFGINVACFAYLMTMIEISAGLLICFGILIRPLSLFLIGAMTFLALALGETPLFHTNIYAIMVALILLHSRPETDQRHEGRGNLPHWLAPGWIREGAFAAAVTTVAASAVIIPLAPQHLPAAPGPFIDLPAGQSAPRINASLIGGGAEGWLVNLDIPGYQLSRQCPPERYARGILCGHAHLYVNDVKAQTIYQNLAMVKALPPGRHMLTISLNAPGHEFYLHRGKPVMQHLAVTVPTGRDALPVLAAQDGPRTLPHAAAYYCASPSPARQPRQATMTLAARALTHRSSAVARSRPH